jgi:hypothetical protein
VLEHKKLGVKGADLCYIQDLLGCESSKTTEIYTHITKKGWDKLRSPIDEKYFFQSPLDKCKNMLIFVPLKLAICMNHQQICFFSTYPNRNGTLPPVGICAFLAGINAMNG